jgi:hypothetical protein
LQLKKALPCRAFLFGCPLWEFDKIAKTGNQKSFLSSPVISARPLFIF